MRQHRHKGLRPLYPVTENVPVEGDLPEPPIRSMDFYPNGVSPYYQHYAGAAGRGLAGVDMQNAEPIKDYANELDVLQAADDVVGNGIFDPNGSHGNVHPDQGVFADHQSLPGYVDRDQFYAPSEVQDATTDAQVMYVPGGAVSIDDAQMQAFRDRNLWELPPSVNPWGMVEAPFVDEVIPQEASWPVGQTDTTPASLGKYFVVGVIAGLSVGMFLALVMPTKKRAAA